MIIGTENLVTFNYSMLRIHKKQKETSLVLCCLMIDCAKSVHHRKIYVRYVTAVGGVAADDPTIIRSLSLITINQDILS